MIVNTEFFQSLSMRLVKGKKLPNIISIMNDRGQAVTR